MLYRLNVTRVTVLLHCVTVRRSKKLAFCEKRKLLILFCLHLKKHYAGSTEYLGLNNIFNKGY